MPAQRNPLPHRNHRHFHFAIITAIPLRAASCSALSTRNPTSFPHKSLAWLSQHRPGRIHTYTHIPPTSRCAGLPLRAALLNCTTKKIKAGRPEGKVVTWITSCKSSGCSGGTELRMGLRSASQRSQPRALLHFGNGVSRARLVG